MNTKIEMNALPQPPANSVFTIEKIDTVVFPHTYCVTPRHVNVAANHFSGILGKDAILAAEKLGIYCETCKHQGLFLTYEEHKSSLTLFIEVPQNHDLDAIPGLHSYLSNNKEEFIKLGIQGFAFPTE